MGPQLKKRATTAVRTVYKQAALLSQHLFHSVFISENSELLGAFLMFQYGHGGILNVRCFFERAARQFGGSKKFSAASSPVIAPTVMHQDALIKFVRIAFRTF